MAKKKNRQVSTTIEAPKEVVETPKEVATEIQKAKVEVPKQRLIFANVNKFIRR